MAHVNIIIGISQIKGDYSVIISEKCPNDKRILVLQARDVPCFGNYILQSVCSSSIDLKRKFTFTFHANNVDWFIDNICFSFPGRYGCNLVSVSIVSLGDSSFLDSELYLRHISYSLKITTVWVKKDPHNRNVSIAGVLKTKFYKHIFNYFIFTVSRKSYWNSFIWNSLADKSELCQANAS